MECDVDEYCKSMLHMRKDLFSQVDENIKNARYKHDFDKKHQPKKVCICMQVVCTLRSPTLHKCTEYFHVILIGAGCGYTSAAT